MNERQKQVPTTEAMPQANIPPIESPEAQTNERSRAYFATQQKENASTAAAMQGQQISVTRTKTARMPAPAETPEINQSKTAALGPEHLRFLLEQGDTTREPESGLGAFQLTKAYNEAKIRGWEISSQTNATNNP